jgi:acyl CoA:acetate/3-ketoacid CoA transferase beta subunit
MSSTATAVTRAEICVAACADVWRDGGETFASPMGLTPRLGARLARRTFAPDLLLSDGEAFLLAPPDGDGESTTVEGWMPFRSVFDTLAHGRRHVMMGASQIDRFGNHNIASIGDQNHPKTQLLGVRGAPGNTVNHATSYWVPRHDTRVFVPVVDVICGVGTDRAQAAGSGAARFHDLRAVVTELAVLDFGGTDGTMRLRSVHPGVTVDEVVTRTGFPLETAGATETRTPTADELRLIREEIDPQATRNREVPA